MYWVLYQANKSMFLLSGRVPKYPLDEGTLFLKHFDERNLKIIATEIFTKKWVQLLSRHERKTLYSNWSSQNSIICSALWFAIESVWAFPKNSSKICKLFSKFKIHGWQKATIGSDEHHNVHADFDFINCMRSCIGNRIT